MRWFVEVSHVGDSTPAERYCLEAKAWQAALQDTRKLRGDAGPLSKFSIELLDDGYRAVDPVLKIRYLVNQAPPDAPLTAPLPPNGIAHAIAAPTPSVSAAPTPSVSAALTPSVSAAPAPSVSAAPTPSVSAAPTPSVSAAPTPSVSAAPTPLVSRVVAIGPAARTSPSIPDVAKQAAHEPAKATESLVPRPGPPRPTSVRAPALSPEPPRAVPSGAPPGESITVPKPAPLPVLRASEPPLVASSPSHRRESLPIDVPSFTPFELLRRRSEEPTPRAPITYREEAYVVASGTERPAVEALLKDRLSVLKAELSSGPPGKLVQLAIFDHGFSDKPLRPPLGTLAWKDWRGEPVLGFPAFGEAAPPISSRPPPPLASATDLHINGVTSASASAPAPAATSARAIASAPAPAATSAGPIASALAPAATSAAPIVSAPAPAAAPDPAPAPAVASVPEPAAASAPRAPAASNPSLVRATPTPSAPRASRPKLIVPRRRAGEDLISELFEVMHDLHFARNIAIGAEFVAEVLQEVIPSDVLLIQIFDIDTRKFVVVRARGAGAEKALLHSTPDNDPKIVEIMRRPNARAERPNGSKNFKTGRWSFIKEEISEVLAGPVRQGGRYLGLIEIANPLGGDPFHQTEINALDYICEQFADFVASRPIVLDADVILGR